MNPNPRKIPFSREDILIYNKDENELEPCYFREDVVKELNKDLNWYYVATLPRPNTYPIISLYWTRLTSIESTGEKITCYMTMTISYNMGAPIKQVNVFFED